MKDTSFWGSVVGGVTDLVGELTFLEETCNSLEKTKKNIIWIVVVIAVVVIVLIMMSRKSD